jgi:phenylpropionate dioxygenase-like ring-hydroxylating dioxygenase large terminal subunit
MSAPARRPVSGFAATGLVVATTRELRDIPQAVKVLGEELVLFRDEFGKLGLLRLEYGDIENGGIRCPYYGRAFKVQGHCLEMPAGPKGSKFPQNVKHLFYAVRESGGLIFAYMGPDQKDAPPLPKYSPLIDRGGQRQIEQVRHCEYDWFNFFARSRLNNRVRVMTDPSS